MRADGRVATRNYIGVLTSVNCSATVARAIADHFRRDIHPEALAAFPNVDGVVALTHGARLRDRQRRRAAAGAAPHARAAMRGTRTSPRSWSWAWAARPTRSPACSSRKGCATAPRCTPSTSRTPAARARPWRTASSWSQWLLEEANKRRSASRCSASHITVGLQCGGSDGYSGISANPALGAAVDRLVRHGGTAILSRDARDLRRRTPADAPRASRPPWPTSCSRASAGGSTTASATDAEMDNNPSAGNKAGGLTTILEKVARRDRQERHHQPGRRVRVRPAGHRQGPGLHGHAGLRPGVGHRPGGRRREPDLLHHRPRLGLRLRAVAVAQAEHQHRAVAQAGRRHRHQLRRGRRRHAPASTRWASASSG